MWYVHSGLPYKWTSFSLLEPELSTSCLHPDFYTFDLLKNLAILSALCNLAIVLAVVMAPEGSPKCTQSHTSTLCPQGGDVEGERAEIHSVPLWFLFHWVICNFTCVLMTKWDLMEWTARHALLGEVGPQTLHPATPLNIFIPKSGLSLCSTALNTEL